MLSVQSIVKELPIWIYFVQNGISIYLMTCSENYKLPFLLHFFQESDSVGSDVKPHSILYPIQTYRNFYVCFIRVIFVTMDDSFIQINVQSLFMGRSPRNGYFLIIPLSLKIHLDEFILE